MIEKAETLYKDFSRVETVAIDDVVDAPAKVKAIKLDVAGAELLALSDMERTLARAENVQMFVGCNPVSLGRAGSDAQAPVKRLNNLGFAVSVIDEQNRRLASVDEKFEGIDKPVNRFCARN